MRRHILEFYCCHGDQQNLCPITWEFDFEIFAQFLKLRGRKSKMSRFRNTSDLAKYRAVYYFFHFNRWIKILSSKLTLDLFH